MRRGNKKVQILDLSKVLRPYENKWVALSEDHQRVVGSGDTLKQAQKQAEEKGQKHPVYTKVLPFDISYVPTFK